MIAKVETPAVLRSAFVSYGRVDCIGEMWHGGDSSLKMELIVDMKPGW
jgi:hypothetical protein